MFANYIKIAVRFLYRNITFSIIKISGLAFGMACFILIYLWVKDELSFDNFHVNKEKIYRVVHDKQESDGIKRMSRTCPSLAPALKEIYPEVKYSTRVNYTPFEVGYQTKTFSGNGAYIDPDFFRIFSFPLLYGDKDHVLDDKLIIVLTEDFAKKIFGRSDVVGESLTVEGVITIKVTGVVKSVPKNSHIQFDFLLNYSVLYDFGFPKEIWALFNNPWYTYIYVEDEESATKLNGKIGNIITEHAPSVKTNVYLQPLSEIYLFSNFLGEVSKLGDVRNVIIFSALALIILVVACFNFMNLCMAQSSSRAHEVGLRKVSGANRGHIIWQYILESILLSFIAHILAMLLVELFLPTFNLLLNKSLYINYLSIEFVLLIISMVVITGVFAGSYPAFYLSNQRPILVLKDYSESVSRNSLFRISIVIFQFFITITLIIVTGTMVMQLRFMQNKKIGFNKENLISVPISRLRNNYKPLKERLVQSGRFEGITVCSHEVTDVTHNIPASWDDKSPDSDVVMNVMWVDKDYLKTMKMELAYGNDLKEYSPNDTSYHYILNEEAIRQIGYSEPVGKRFTLGTERPMNGIIVGVVKDFHFKPFKYKIEPMVLSNFPNENYIMYIRLNEGNYEDDIRFVEKIWNEISPGMPFEYSFLNDKLQELYNNEYKLADLMKYSSLLGILISCLGLYGLSSYLTERRTKEVGIRKAIGATNSSIIYLFTFQLIKWVLAAIILSWPVSWFICDAWLQNFSYRIEISYSIFILSTLSVVVIAMISVVGKTLAKANLNPARALRYE